MLTHNREQVYATMKEFITLVKYNQLTSMHNDVFVFYRTCSATNFPKQQELLRRSYSCCGDGVLKALYCH